MLKICHSLAPSIVAASDSSKGMLRKNWRSRKMLNALPKKAGTQRGEGTDPAQRLEERVDRHHETGNGTIIVARVTKKNASRPRQRRRAKPYAARAHREHCADDVQPAEQDRVSCVVQERDVAELSESIRERVFVVMPLGDFRYPDRRLRDVSGRAFSAVETSQKNGT